jgi:hypothetical protein
MPWQKKKNNPFPTETTGVQQSTVFSMRSLLRCYNQDKFSSCGRVSSKGVSEEKTEVCAAEICKVWRLAMAL